MKILAMAVIAVPLLIAAAPASNWQKAAVAAAAPFIEKANDEWIHAIVTGDADVMSTPYADNGIFIGPDGSVTRGRDAIRAMYARSHEHVKVLRARIHTDGRVAADPDDIYEWGTAVMQS